MATSAGVSPTSPTSPTSPVPSQSSPRARVAPIFRRQSQVQAAQAISMRSQLRSSFHQSGVATFVSTRMDVVTKGETHAIDEIVFHSGITHYRLTPLFWAYLRHAFDNATRACDEGKLDESTYRELLARISRVYDLAVEQFGIETLKSAERLYSPAKWKRHCERLTQAQPETSPLRPASSYAGVSNPATHRFPADAVTGVIRPVSNFALAQVDAIRDQALALGWNMDQLYRNVGVASRDWGLVCYLGSDARINAVTGQSIEIVHRSAQGDRSLRFYNNQIEQPWLRIANKGGD